VFLSDRLDEVRGTLGALPDDQRLRRLFDETWAHEMADSPESATILGYPGHDDRWSDQSPAAWERRANEAGLVLDVLTTIDRAQLSEQGALSAVLFEKAYRDRVASAAFHGELQPIDQLQGVQQDPAMYIEAQPSSTAEQRAAIIERLRALPDLVDQNIELMRIGMAHGITPPRICLRDVPQQVKNQLVDDPLASPLLVAIAASDDESARDDAAAAYRDHVAPAYERLHRFVVEEYLPRTRETIACRDLPDGEAWYAHLVAHHTTTDLSPTEIHEIGLAEVARIRSAMEQIATSEGHDTFEAYALHLRTDPKHHHTDAAVLLEGYREIGRRVDARLPELFGRLPKLGYEIVAVPPYAEKSQTAAYYLPGAPDGSRRGQFFANTYDLPSRYIWEMESLTLHEAVPGHHLQIAIAQELEGLPDFQRNAWFTAYGEGWGLYAESLGDEVGLYTDPASRYGALTAEVWRAIRLVLDTGLHAMGWTRDRAISYFQDVTGREDHDIVVEVDRYIVWPGQALGYKIGELKLKELRARAAAAMGASFDLRAFHDEVLRFGCLPLDILEDRISEFIAR
jgi:uncharacterized protein (DUF885 family)